MTFPALLVTGTGCEEFRTSLLGLEAQSDVVDDTGVDYLGCAEIDGTYVADALDLSAEDDPSLWEDFGDYSDFTVVFDASRERFESMLVVGDEAFVSTGNYFLINDKIVFESPLVAGMGLGHTALGCDYDGVSLTLYGATTYDFVDDEMDAYLDADLLLSLTGI